MIVGEAPGKNEDSTRKPFTGPAGQLLDKIWQAAGMSTTEWYLTNVVKCRPVAGHNSGKQNYTPKSEQMETCFPILYHEIWYLRPTVIVTLGKTATEQVLNRKVNRMGDIRGQFFMKEYAISPDFDYAPTNKFYSQIFPMIHPAAILHATGTPLCNEYKRLTWNDVRLLKNTIKEDSLDVR